MSLRKSVLCVFLINLFCCGIAYSQERSEMAEKLQEESGTSEERKLKFNGSPYVIYTPETDFAAGAGGVFIFYTSKDKEISPSKVGAGGYYTKNKQYKLSVDPVMYFNRDKLYIRTPFSFGYFVDKFWGIGNSTEEKGTEAYTTNVFAASLNVQVPAIWFSADRAGIILDYNYTKIDDKKDNTYLKDDSVTGSNGGTLFGIGTDLVWDSRDNLFFPNKGNYRYLKIIFYPSSLSDFVFHSFEADIRHYTSFSPDHILAGNVYFAAAGGDVPFYMLPALGGGNRMRGYFKGRYRDNVYSMAQLEYRRYFWRRLGFVVFAGLGDVAPGLMKFRFNDLKYSYGLGLRYLYNKKQKLNLRMDVGFGNDGNNGVYLGIEEAF